MNHLDDIPVQYRDGYTTFLDMEIDIDRRVFIPRPETELLVRTASTFLRQNFLIRPFLLDICGGSGAVSLSLKKLVRGSRIILTDVSPDALLVARKNIEKFGFTADIELVKSDMFESLLGRYELAFDAIVSNPPYVSEKDYKKTDAWIKAEPPLALLSGNDGMDHLSALIKEGMAFLKKSGFLAVEIGYDQAEKVKGLFTESGYGNIKGYFDNSGFERVIVGWKI